MRQGVNGLGQQSRIGRSVRDLPIEFREWRADCGDSGYVLRNRVDAGTAVILAVRHQKDAGC